MKSKIEVPKWYPLPVYKKMLTPEEWLHEIFKRDQINHILSNPFFTEQTKLEIFNAIILRDEIQDIRSTLRPQLGQPIRDISITETLYMAELIKQNEAYREHPDREILESAIRAKVTNSFLSEKQRTVFSNFYDLPWHSFHKESKNKDWYPKIPYLMGAPVTIDAYYFRADIKSELNKLLNRWIHKGKLPALSENVFSNWSEKKILAIFDLRVWYKIKNINLPKIELARLLWPKPPVSKKKNATTVYLDDYIDEAIEATDKNIHEGSVNMLVKTCESRKFLQEQQAALKASLNIKIQPE